ncbi:ParB/RepB/Spo0J family partition protein [sulfur-oxidizing endosymbiont of Gigantopelta aegis]|uniref:ParB/RepB/Spo0J family partition protein n=1 Tax=sulfur-oxidizing endosymbiont of Gigantopelta aegis TaxID=2794934 RepID=UPI0018DDE454|nr:ParB/RepB/Spo0J family partition protein [sulfur-oxidizing endosymbiont of Gigantopelta aegis]
MSKGADLSGLDDFNVSSLLTGNKKAKRANEGQLSYAPIDKFIEDENNARQSFDSDKLNELVESIKAISPVTNKMTGVKQPLSVRRHPDKEGYFIINGGHRRYRAAKIAGLTELPYFISDENDELDNVVDNLIREGLKADEVAKFIEARILAGDKKSEIAKRLGKQLSYVSDHAVFSQLDDSIKSIFDEKYCESIRGLAKLHRAFKKHPDKVKNYCKNLHQKVSVSDIDFFIKSLDETQKQDNKNNDLVDSDDSKSDSVENNNEREIEPQEPKHEPHESKAIKQQTREEPEKDVSKDQANFRKVRIRVNALGNKGDLLLRPCEIDDNGDVLLWVKLDEEDEPVQCFSHSIQIDEISGC